MAGQLQWMMGDWGKPLELLSGFHASFQSDLCAISGFYMCLYVITCLCMQKHFMALEKDDPKLDVDHL